jgi:hypothetical protein
MQGMLTEFKGNYSQKAKFLIFFPGLKSHPLKWFKHCYDLQSFVNTFLCMGGPSYQTHYPAIAILC